MNADADMRGIRVFGALHRYYQGPGALDLVGQIVIGLGQRPLLVADAVVGQLLHARLAQSCLARGMALPWVQVHGEVTRAMVQRLVAEARAESSVPDVVFAAGGGKGVDAGKAVARALGAKLIVLPTAASNDGPCSASFVYYDESHRMQSVEHLPRNPDAVIVDTAILVKAPRALLISGIGDALCKRYEGSQACTAQGVNLFGGRITVLAQQILQTCERVIRDDALAGLRALSRGTPDAAFERLTEALILLAGLAFENSGLSIAHAMTRGLTRIPEISVALHGQQVAYGLLVQFMLERRTPDFVAEQLRFHRAVGLATSLRALGVAAPDRALYARIAEGVMTAPHLKHFTHALTASDVEAAMRELEARSTRFSHQDVHEPHE